MFNRRQFIDKLGVLSAASVLSSLQPAWSRNLSGALHEADGIDPDTLAGEEDFWYYVQQAYTQAPGFVNLNNAGISPAPRSVQDAMKRYYDQCNEAPTYYMWRILDSGRESLRRNLGRLAGCDAGEIALQRNATEALETVIFGLRLERGDEVILAKQDYPSMISAWKQREMRDGIKLVWVNLELPSEDENYLTESYTSLFTAKTKVVQVTHMINWIGQIMPVTRIAQAARKKGVEVLVDGAHTFAHFDFSIPDLQCDYFGTSLHKWLCAPIGTGMLYVRKEKIGQLYPLFGNGNPTLDDIRKFEHLGTRPFYIEEAIDKAIEFHEMIGIKRKEERLFYLRKYWMDRVRDMPGVQIHSPVKKGYGCAIGLVSVEGRKNHDLETFLMDNYRIHTVSIEVENISGVRITPNVYTSTKNLDLLVTALAAFCKK